MSSDGKIDLDGIGDVEGHALKEIVAGVGAAAVLSVVTATADHGVHTATALLKQVVPHPHEITGWILVKAADTVLAQAHVTDGRATATWTMPAHTALSSVVLSYTGDDRYAPALRTLDL